MTQPVLLLLLCIFCFKLADAYFGYRIVYVVSYGAFALLAAIIALTFFWLWLRRSTPLALGMAFGWLGAASVMAWWWLFNLLDRPDAMVENSALFLFLSVYFVGAILHLEVFGRSFGIPKRLTLLPVFLALGLSMGVALVV